ncbi:MAG: hypothetical protein ACOY3N_11995 [Bradyrhizobium sp.]|jgi:hypothetical protein|nr:hypothetical protein [Shinella sp. HZN7]
MADCFTRIIELDAYASLDDALRRSAGLETEMDSTPGPKLPSG